MASSQSSAVQGPTLASSQADDAQEKENLAKARKQHAAWVMGAATLRLTKLCAPQCLHFDRVQVSAEEKTCLTQCVRGLHNVNEATLSFFVEFEREAREKQSSLVNDLAQEVLAEKREALATRRQKRHLSEGFVKM